MNKKEIDDKIRDGAELPPWSDDCDVEAKDDTGESPYGRTTVRMRAPEMCSRRRHRNLCGKIVTFIMSLLTEKIDVEAK